MAAAAPTALMYTFCLLSFLENPGLLFCSDRDGCCGLQAEEEEEDEDEDEDGQEGEGIVLADSATLIPPKPAAAPAPALPPTPRVPFRPSTFGLGNICFSNIM